MVSLIRGLRLATYVAAAALPVVYFAPIMTADADDISLDATWRLSITNVNRAPGFFTSLVTFFPGGGVVESHEPLYPVTPFGPLLSTSGHGEWKRTDEREIEVRLLSLVQRGTVGLAAGQDFGTESVQMRLVLEEGGRVLAGRFESDLRDTEGRHLATLSGTVRGVSIIRDARGVFSSDPAGR